MKKRIFSHLSLALAILMSLSAVSCVAHVIAAEDLSANYTRKTAETASVDGRFRDAAANFAFSLLQNIPMEEGENALLSPLSALACLGMITGGADGDTLAQLERALDLPEETLTRSLYAYVNSLYSGENCRFRMANSIWTKNGNGAYRVSEEFLQKNADWYGAEIFRADFSPATVNDVNQWVKEHTDGMIEEILNDLSPDTVMLLINALVFDAKWQTKYEEKQIGKYTFTAYDGTETEVDMMNSGEYTYVTLNGADGFVKNYEGGAYSFVALLPEEGKDVYEFARSITGEAFTAMWDARSGRTISARIPEFRYEDGFSLLEALEALGVTDLFSPIEADLSRLGRCDGGNLYVSAIEQKTVIEVSRNGTKAAAVTWGTIEATSGAPTDPISIYLDRPFVYAIVDNATGLPLFIGVVATVV